jgi:hypothetical protein
MPRMTRLIPLALAAALLAAPAAAQAEGNSLIEEGADLLLRGLIEEVAPPLQELAGIGQEVLPILQALGEEFGPALSEVAGQIDSITYYEPPVIAPNGDIVMRRRADAPAWVPPAEDPEPESDPIPAPEPDPAPDSGTGPDDEGGLRDRPPFDVSPPPEGEPLPDLQTAPDGALEL